MSNPFDQFDNTPQLNNPFDQFDDTQNFPTQQGYISKEQKPNVFVDVSRGAISGLTQLPRGAANLAEKYLPNAFTSGISDVLDMTEYKPQTGAGKFAEFAGELAPAFFLPQVKILQGAKLLPKILNQGLTGAYQGGLIAGADAANEGRDAISEGLKGAGIGGLFGGALPVAGAGFEKIQPLLAKTFAGIPIESYQRALQSIKGGNSVFNKANKVDENQVIDLIRNAKDEAYPVDDLFSPFPNFYENQYKQLGQNLEGTANKYFTPESEYNKAYRDLAEQISSANQEARSIYGKNIGAEKSALNNDETIPYNELIQTINSIVDRASQGSNINPAKERASGVINFIRDQLQKGAFKNSGYTNQQIEDLLASQVDNVAISPEVQRMKDIYKAQGATDQEVNDVLKGLGYTDQEINNIPGLDDLSVQRKDLHVLKQDLQHQVNQNADWKPSTGLINDLSGEFNNILRQNPGYAKANDEFSALKQFLDNPENAWLNNTNSIASKLANAGGKSGELNDVIDKIKQLESLLPQNKGLANELKNLVLNQSVQKDFLGNVPSSIFKDISKYDRASLSEQGALDTLNSLNPNNPIGKYQELLKQNLSEKEMLDNILNQNKQARTFLPESAIKRPETIRKQPLEVQDAFNQLNQNASSGNKFEELLKDLYTQKDFSGGLSKWAATEGVRRGIAGTAGIGAGVGAGAIGGFPAILALLAQQSPAMQKLLLQSYGFGSKNIAPNLVKTGATTAGLFNNND